MSTSFIYDKILIGRDAYMCRSINSNIPEYLYGRYRSSNNMAQLDSNLIPKTPIPLQIGDHRHVLDNVVFRFCKFNYSNPIVILGN